jgi:hypothetical protein
VGITTLVSCLPVLVLGMGTALAHMLREDAAAADQHIAGLELGADDYVTKPFSPRELVLRVQVILRRGGGAAAARDVRSYGGGALVIGEPRGGSPRCAARRSS